MEAGGKSSPVPQSNSAASACQIWLRELTSLCRREHRHDLEGYAGAPPMQNPGLQQAQIVAAHELKAACKARLDPAVDIVQAIGQPPPTVAHPLVDRDHIIVVESLDDHEQH